MSTVGYELVDVFTDRPFAGNPLSVVFGAEALAGDQMQAMAAEFNLAETVFVLPPTGSATYRARIFTPTHELPFAGHPSVGCAVTVVRRGLAPAGELVQECGAGLLPITVTPAGTATLTGGPPTLGPELDAGPLLSLVGLSADDLAGAAPRVAGCGLDWHFLPVRASAPAAASVVTARSEVSGISVFAWDESSRTAHARVFCPGMGVPEDPATGSAALGLGVWLVASGWLPADGTSTYTVRQGAERGRPSTLECAVTASAGETVSATVTGHVVEIGRGEMAIPPFIG